MKQILMGIVLLGVGVIFNPPLILKEFSLSPSLAQARSKEKADSEFRERSPNFKIVINVPAMELSLLEGNELVRKFPIAVGQARYPSPTNKLDQLTHIIWNPWWHPPDREWAKDAEVTPPGQNNPLGVVKMPLSNAVLLHGTNKPYSINTPASHACIRMFNEDARTLAWTLQSNLTPHFEESLLEEYARERWKTVRVNLSRSVPVEFVYDPIEIDGKKMILHRDVYGRINNKKQAVIDALATFGYAKEEIDLEYIDEVVREWRRGRNTVNVLIKELMR